MRVKKICVQNFLSFDDFELDLDDNLTVIVGPNGSGKTNLVRALRLVREVVGALATWKTAPGWEPARRLGGPPELKVGLELEFGDPEMDLWELFFEAALASVSPVTENRDAFHSFLKASRQAKLHRRLRRSRLEVEFGGPPHNLWSVRLAGEGLCFTFRSGRFVIGLSPERAAGSGFIPQAIHDYLRGLLRPTDPASGEPAPFAAEAMEVAGRGLEALMKLAEKQNTALIFDVDLILLQSSPELHRRFTAEFRSVNNQAGFLHVLDRVFGQGLFVTEDIRPLPQVRYPAERLGQPEDLAADGANLGLYLFWLKNSPDPDRRQTFREICRVFKNLAEGDLDVSLEGQQDAFAVTVWVRRQHTEAPLSLAGAGIWELLFLSALLGHKEATVVLDEPALNLHPPLQRRLLGEIRRAAESGLQVVLITHSPYLVPTRDKADLRRVVRFVWDDRARATRRHRFPMAKGKGAKAVELLDREADVRALLFAEGVVLVEGETEAAALPIWWSKLSEDRNLSVRHVGGYTAAKPYIRLLGGWKIPWAFVVDGGHLKDTLKALRKELGLRHDEAQVDRLPFDEARKLAEGHGIFTLNRAERENGGQAEFETLPGVKAGLKDVPPEYDSKPLKGRWIALGTDPPAEVKELYDKVTEYLAGVKDPNDRGPDSASAADTETTGVSAQPHRNGQRNRDSS
jgi:predicted ATPase